MDVEDLQEVAAGLNGLHSGFGTVHRFGVKGEPFDDEGAAGFFNFHFFEFGVESIDFLFDLGYFGEFGLQLNLPVGNSNEGFEDGVHVVFVSF